MANERNHQAQFPNCIASGIDAVVKRWTLTPVANLNGLPDVLVPSPEARDASEEGGSCA